MIFKSTFIATAVAAGALFFGGTTESEARPRISFHVDSGGGYHGGHGYDRGYRRGYCPPRRPVYHHGYNRGYRQSYRRPSYRRPSYRRSGCGY